MATAGPISRRALLLGGAGAAGVAAAAGAYLSRGLWRPGATEDGVINVIQRLFGEDIASDAVLDAFADLYIARSDGELYKRDILLLTEPKLADPAFALLDRIQHRERFDLAFWENDIGQSFLRNTTMAYRRAGAPIEIEERVMDLNACTNPLARFDYDDA